MIEFPARALRLLVSYRYLYVVVYLEINLSTMSIRVSTSLFLGLLYNRTSRILFLVHNLSEILGLVSI